MTHRIPLGPFELYRRIGRGGMGEVWEGLHIPQQIPVAVKILTHGGVRKDTYVSAFRTEVRAAAGLNHHGIVTVLDYGEMPAGAARLSEGLFSAQSPYIVMEFARRGSLKRFVNAISWRQLKVALFTVLDALAHAHAVGVIHRDLKPANILVGCGDEGDTGIKLTDFGLAHAVDQHEFAGVTDAGWGTPQFMAPEQFRGAWRDYGPWTDLYALGVMSYYLTTGAYPFTAEDTGGFARAHQLSKPKPLQARFPVPEGFDQWVDRLMQKRPRDRYQCAADAAFALQKLSDPEERGDPLRSTVSMMPIQGARDHWMTEDKLKRSRETATWGTAVADDEDLEEPADTYLERAATTKLVDIDFTADEPPPNTASFSLIEWGSPKSDSKRNFDIGGDVPPLPHTWRKPERPPASPKLIGAGLGLFGLRTLPIVDRDDERDYLWELLRDVHREGEARAVLIRGPAGTGKSRVARWLTIRAAEVGAAKILKSMFSPIAGPGDGLSRMLAQHLRAGGMDYEQTLQRVEAVLQRQGVRDEVELTELASFIMPVGKRIADGDSLSFRMEGRNPRYGLLYRHLRRMSEERPVVVWFDDVQWGADALAFVRYVIERQHQQPLPVLFVCTARNEALVERRVETQLVSDIANNRRGVVLDIDPLGTADTGELVRELLYLSPGLAREVEKRCGGNPLFAVQLVGDWVAGQKLRFGPKGFELKEGVGAEIPDDLHTIWRERLALLLRKRPIDDLKALEVAAALGTNVTMNEWYAACDHYGVSSPPDLMRELFETGLANPIDFGFEFCHGLFRESLERSAREHERWTEVNAACLKMLQEQYSTREFPFSERFALHAIAAEREMLAIGPLLRGARDRIDRSEFDVAMQLLDQRDELLEDENVGTADPDVNAGLIVRAQVHLWQGNYELAERYAASAAVEARRHSWTSVLGRAQLTEALAHLYRGDLDRATRLFEKAGEELEKAADAVGQAQAKQGLCRVAEARGRIDEARELVLDALATLKKHDHFLGQAQCYNALGDLAREQGQWEQALDYVGQALRIFESLNNSIGIADCINDIAELHRFRGEFQLARDNCLRALQIYEDLGSEHSINVRINLGLTLAASGHLPQARQLLDECRARLERTEQDGQLAFVDMLLVPTLLALGERDLAERRFETARPVLERTGLRHPDLHSAVEAAIEEARTDGLQEFAAQLQAFLEELE